MQDVRKKESKKKKKEEGNQRATKMNE